MIAGTVVSCSTAPDPALAEAAAAEAASIAKGEEHVALVKKFLTAFEKGDNETSLEEYMNTIVNLKESVDSMKFSTMAIMPNTVEEGDLTGDYVFWWGDQSDYLKEYKKSVRLRLHTIYKIEEGKIAWSSDFWDSGDLKNQLQNK